MMRFLRKLNGSLCRLNSGTGTTIVKAAPAVKMGSVVSKERAFSQVEESKNGPKNMQNSLSRGILVSQHNDCDCYPLSGSYRNFQF